MASYQTFSTTRIAIVYSFTNSGLPQNQITSFAIAIWKQVHCIFRGGTAYLHGMNTLRMTKASKVKVH